VKQRLPTLSLIIGEKSREKNEQKEKENICGLHCRYPCPSPISFF
jgi:hypothetical protein